MVFTCYRVRCTVKINNILFKIKLLAIFSQPVYFNTMHADSLELHIIIEISHTDLADEKLATVVTGNRWW